MQQRKVYGPHNRADLVSHADGKVMRKQARVVALRINEPFVVHTEHGSMTGEAGDWLVTNHPRDDESSDVWVVSAERMKASYVDE